jgi:aspartyl-tRNA(Asn)/glutamyl-tRNA(Gln) amidotransferase subunit C
MSKITREDVKWLAKLSLLSLTDTEADKLANDLDELLNYSSVVTTTKQGAEAAAYRNINVMRDDVAVPTDGEPLLASAPQSESSYFVVPRVLD